MKAKLLLLLLLVVAVTIAFASTVSERENPVRPIEGEKVVVRLVAHSTSIGRGSRDTGDGSTVLRIGETGHPSVGAGFRPDRGLDMSLTTPNATPEELAKEPYNAFAWWSAMTVVDATLEQITLDVEWARYERTASGTMTKARGDRRRIVLKEGERHILDFLEAPSLTPKASVYVNMSIGVEASIEEDPAFAERQIGYDLWLVDDDGTRQQTARLQKTGKQGEKLQAAFDTLRWPTGARFGSGSRAEATGKFDVDLRGRLRADGTIEVEAGLDRFIGLHPEGRIGPGGIGDGGKTRVRVKPGEVVRIELPPFGPATITNWDGPSDWLHAEKIPPNTPVFASKGTITIALKPFFAGHTMSLTLVARPL